MGSCFLKEEREKEIMGALCGHENELTSGFSKYFSFSLQQTQRRGARELLLFTCENYFTQLTKMKGNWEGKFGKFTTNVIP